MRQLADAAVMPKEYHFSRQEFQAGNRVECTKPHYVEPSAVMEWVTHAQEGHEEQVRKKWTPPADPFGFENHRAGENRVRLLKSEGGGAWVIRFAKPLNEDCHLGANRPPMR